MVYWAPSKAPPPHPGHSKALCSAGGAGKRAQCRPRRRPAAPGHTSGSRSLTCPSRSAGASRSVGAASGPGGPRSPTRSTCCSTGSPCSWARGRGRWWHCGPSRRRALPTQSTAPLRRRGDRARQSVRAGVCTQGFCTAKAMKHSARRRTDACPAFLTSL